jgi:hypothetical protein
MLVCVGGYLTLDSPGGPTNVDQLTDIEPWLVLLVGVGRLTKGDRLTEPGSQLIPLDGVGGLTNVDQLTGTDYYSPTLVGPISWS